MHSTKTAIKRSRTSIPVALALLVTLGTATAGLARAGDAPESALDREPVSVMPRDQLGMVQGGTNIDFASKALVGPTRAVAYNPTAKHVYVGSRRVFSVYSALDPENLLLLGRLEIPQSTFDGVILSMNYPGGDHVFLTVNSDGLYSIDISDPSHPTIADSIAKPGTAWMDVDGSVAYLSCSPRTVALFDIGDPENLSFLGEYAQFAQGLIGTIRAANQHAYVVGANGLFDPYGIWIIDGTNPAAPVKINELYSGWGDIGGLGGDKERLYTTVPGFRLEVWDLDTPAAPGYLGGDTPVYPGIGSIFPSGTIGYAPVGNSLAILDLGDPDAHVLLGSTSGMPSWGLASDLASSIGYAYIAAHDAGVQVVDVFPPQTPSVVGSYPTPGDVEDVTVSGRIAYYRTTIGIVAVNNSIVDRSEIVSITEVGATAVHADGNRLYYGDSALHVLDVTDPANPSELGSVPVSDDVEAIDTAGSLAYLALGTDGLSIVDVGDPSHPTEIGSTPVPGQALDVTVLGPIAYVASGSAGLVILDVADPSNPVQLGSLDTPDSAIAVDVSGSYAYVADDFSRLLLIVDVHDPADPILVGQYPTPGAVSRARDVVVVGDLAYVAAYGAGLRVLDVSAPWAPVEVASYATQDDFLAVAFQAGYALTAERDGGASILHYVGQCFDAFEPNDDFGEAHPISDGVVYSPQICDANDVDYFSITPSAGDTLEITMQPPPGKNYNLFLYGAAQQLVAASVTSGDATESIEYVANEPGPYYVVVSGAAGQFDASLFYTLFFLAHPCPAPTQEVYIYTSDLDENFNVVFYVQDPNQPETVTGYNLYRSTSPVGPFDLVGENLTDFDEGIPNVQIVDVDSDSCGPLCFYKITAVNGTCGAEGPGGPPPLPACPAVSPCNGVSCVRSGPPLNLDDTGDRACLTLQGSALNCGNQTVHVVTYDCTDAACCFDSPPCLCAIGSCTTGTYLECR